MRGEGGHASVNNGSMMEATGVSSSKTSSQASFRGVSTGVESEGGDKGGSGSALAVKVEELGGAAQVPVDEDKVRFRLLCPVYVFLPIGFRKA